ncbi:transposase [Streptomyces sp. NPDC086783]|uniref:IS110 family transposase n=1 Tax=Streptomyces sp. NPDC086783 TaxID=3365758 RepID=UPI0038096445
MLCETKLTGGDVPEIWAGADIGKMHSHAMVINTEGERLLARRIENNETTELLALIGDVLAISDDALWAADLAHGAALPIGLLPAQDQLLSYLTGLAV